MSVETIKNALRRVYEDKDEQIVIWYDEDGGFEEYYDAVMLDGVEKIKFNNNSFWIKYRIYYEAPKNKYLIYIPHAKPSNRENWLLDVSLSYYEFKADESSMIIQELGLDLRLKNLIDKYIKFFRNAKNKTAFASLVEKHDDEQQLLDKMMAVVSGVKNDTLEDLLYTLFTELSQERETKLKNLAKYELLDEFYKRVQKAYGYSSDEASIMGLVIYLLENRFKLCIKEDDYEGNKNANIFVNHWMQHIKYGNVFKQLSKSIDAELQLHAQIAIKTIDELKECDTYESIEKIIIQELSQRVVSGSITTSQISTLINLRKTKYWYSDFKNYYDALFYASEFLFLQENLSIEVKNFEQGLESYVSQWYKFDYCYRKYLYALSGCSNAAICDGITAKIEKFYANSYLQTLSDEWYNRLREIKEWKFEPEIDQKSFYKHHVEPQLSDNKKLCVIISDALRYESGQELQQRFNTEPNVRTEFSYMVASLPSYTQLGMASLLPHKELSYKEEKFAVFVDGMSSQGTDNRTKILQKTMPESIAILASDFLAMKREELRTYFKPYKLVYIYENSIDSRGKPPTEDQVFEATEECFERIIRLTKKMHNELQWRNVFVTADHGYMYEKTDVNESNFCKVPKGENFLDSNKRMAIGHNLDEADCVLKYSAKELNIAGDAEFLIAKSMQRIRAKGGGSKFVHGGATLQEIIIPLIKVNRNTELKSRAVEFDVIRSTSVITANVFPVTFLQKEAVADKILPIDIQVSIYSQDDELLSDVHEICFDTKDENRDKMHKKVTFHFSKDMTAFNGQNVYLKVMTKAHGTNEFNKELRDKRESYSVNISFGAEEW